MSGNRQGQGSVLKQELFPRETRRIIAAIESVRGRGGEGYRYEGKPGYRNPVKQDTAPCLVALTAAHKPITILEVGTGYGFSTLHFGLAATRANVFTIEFDPTVAEAARMVFAAAGLDYRVYVGTVAEAIDELDREIDMVFIDHQPSMYLPDFLRIESKLAGKAVILADNVNDRRAENSDFVDYVLGKYGGVIVPTQSGLLYSAQ